MTLAENKFFSVFRWVLRAWCACARVFYRVGVCQYPLVDILEYPFVDTYIYDVRFILLTKGKPSRYASEGSKPHVQ